MRWILVLLALSAADAIHAAEPRGNLHPLLRVNSEIIRPGGLNPGLPEEVEHRDIFVTKGGFTSSLLVLRGRDEFETILTRGNGAADSLNALNRALGASRVGIQRDCQILIESPGSQQSGGFYRIRWYGKGIRTNQFQIFLNPERAPEFPICSGEAENLLGAIIRFEGSVSNNPESEIIVSN
jgi:hypothetical protein